MLEIFSGFPDDKYKVFIFLPICNLLASFVFLFWLLCFFKKDTKFALWILLDQSSNKLGLIPSAVTVSYKFSEFNKLGQDSISLRIGPLRSLNAFYSFLSREAIVCFGANLLNYKGETVYP